MAVLSWVVAILPILALLTGCGDISNEVFTQDADFAAAFPGDQTTTLSAPAGATTATPPDLLALSLTVGTSLNDTLATVLSAVDTVRAAPPASRDTTARAWGPYIWDGADLTAQMQLTGGTRYDWALAANSSAFASGSHYAGDTVAAGDGSFAWDASAEAAQTGGLAAGRLDVTYDNRDGVDLLVVEQGLTADPATSPPSDGTYAYALTTGIGDFQYRATIPEPGSPDLAVAAEVHARWIDNVGGRADAWLDGGDLVTEDVWTQCWDGTGTLLYASDTEGLVDVVTGDGGSAACAFHDLAPADRI